MSLQIIIGDITKIKVDAIVNAANNRLLGGGGVDGAIHRAAGKELLEECIKLKECKTGEAKLTLGYKLPARYVIHTVGPVWKGGGYGERELLFSCYSKALQLAKEKECESIAFPMISAGAYGYPCDKALAVAVSAVKEFLLANEMEVYFVIFDKSSFRLDEDLVEQVNKYLDENYKKGSQEKSSFTFLSDFDVTLSKNKPSTISYACIKENDDVSNLFDVIDESFSEMLLRKIDERGITDVQCYKRANIDRKLFSKIRSDKDYHPKKQTALAFAVALELNLTETSELLLKAGYALSHSNKFDIIVEYFIKNAKYDIDEINEVLFSFDQRLLGQ